MHILDSFIQDPRRRELVPPHGTFDGKLWAGNFYGSMDLSRRRTINIRFVKPRSKNKRAWVAINGQRVMLVNDRGELVVFREFRGAREDSREESVAWVLGHPDEARARGVHFEILHVEGG